MTNGVTLTIDACAHPMMRSSDDVRDYLAEPFRRQGFPNLQRYFYPSPEREFLAHSWPEGGGAPGSDPNLFAEHLFGDLGIDRAVLVPLTRGILPDVDLASAICSATNDWLADVWLSAGNSHGRFSGTIRVNPSDPAEAVREINRWRDNPHIVQVAVPLEAHQPYGKRELFPIWEAASQQGLAIAIHADGGTGTELFPSPVGYFQHYVEYISFLPLVNFYHIASFVAEGVFERLPSLRVVIADGMGDTIWPLIWRMDSVWKAIRDRTPWVERAPSDYVRNHVRFCASASEGPTDASENPRYWAANDVAAVQMYASNYPSSLFLRPDDALDGIDPNEREQFLGTNAAHLYGFPMAGRAVG